MRTILIEAYRNRLDPYRYELCKEMLNAMEDGKTFDAKGGSFFPLTLFEDIEGKISVLGIRSDAGFRIGENGAVSFDEIHRLTSAFYIEDTAVTDDICHNLIDGALIEKLAGRYMAVAIVKRN